MSSYDFTSTVNEPKLFKQVKGVKNSPGNREAKPYDLVKIVATGAPGALMFASIPTQKLIWNADPSIGNRHIKRVRGKTEGVQHFTEAIVEFKSLTRQLWSLLDQGLRTITRRRGGFSLRDVMHRESWKDTPSFYLLWQFALSPLISQIEDTLEKLAKIKGTYYGRVTTDGVLDVQPYVLGSSSYFINEAYVRHTTVFEYTVDNSVSNVIMEFLGVNRPLTVLWDLKGWSWAVDYFFNLGELISNLDGDSLTRHVRFISNSILRKVSLSGYQKEMFFYHKDNWLVAHYQKHGYRIVHETSTGYVYLATGSPIPYAEVVSFNRSVGDFPMGFRPEFKFKPKPGTFQFANLASAIAISIRHFDVDPRYFRVYQKRI